MANYARPLNSNELVYNFLVEALELDRTVANDLCTKVMKAELLLQNIGLKSTLQSKDHRKPFNKTDESRIILRRKIFDELIGFERLDDDNAIRLGAGGAKPKAIPRQDHVAIIVTGLPASGKSYIANQLADQIGAYVVDSDFAKRKIPEFHDEFGASLVHDESSLITYGGDSKFLDEFNLFEYCVAQQYNVVVPKIGATVEGLRELREALLNKGYVVHLVLVALDRQEACRRAMSRYVETERYVPLSLVFDVYGNEPQLTYYRIRDDKNWASTLKLSSAHLRDRGALLVHSSGLSPAASLCK